MNRSEANRLADLFNTRQGLLDNIIMLQKGSLSIVINVFNSGYPITTPSDQDFLKETVRHALATRYETMLDDVESQIKELGGTW